VSSKFGIYDMLVSKLKQKRWGEYLFVESCKIDAKMSKLTGKVRLCHQLI